MPCRRYKADSLDIRVLRKDKAELALKLLFAPAPTYSIIPAAFSLLRRLFGFTTAWMRQVPAWKLRRGFSVLHARLSPARTNPNADPPYRRVANMTVQGLTAHGDEWRFFPALQVADR
jgi:hypothetical protein